jgi:hypothetical protein
MGTEMNLKMCIVIRINPLSCRWIATVLAIFVANAYIVPDVNFHEDPCTKS